MFKSLGIDKEGGFVFSIDTMQVEVHLPEYSVNHTNPSNIFAGFRDYKRAPGISTASGAIFSIIYYTGGLNCYW